METIDTLGARVERLEQMIEERAPDIGDRTLRRFWERIPFSAWLKISGPTFAVIALGFGALWNAQQETTRRILDLERSTTNRILEMQGRILVLQEKTTDRILEMQRQILDLHRRDGES